MADGTTTMFILLKFILHPLITNSIDCSKYLQPNSCNLDSNGGCTWITGACRCASPITDNYFVIFDHSSDVNALETDSGVSFLSDLINHGMNANDKLGFSIQQAPYPDSENIALKSWSEWITFIETSISGAGSGYNELVYSIENMIYRYGLSGGSNNRIGIMLTTNYPCGPYNPQNGDTHSGCGPPFNTSTCQILCEVMDTGICSKYVDLVANNIRLLVIYSNDVNNYDFGCITENINDFMYLNTTLSSNKYGLLSNVKANMLDIMCPLEMYNISVTEIKLETSSINIYNIYDAPFIELYNDNNVPINLKQLLFEGIISGTLTVNGSTNPRILTDEYLVIYNADIGNVTCKECNCIQTDGILCSTAVYIPCGINYSCQFNTSMNYNNWYIKVKDTIQTYDFTVTDLSYSNTIMPNTNGYTIEYNTNTWMTSCNEHGTPGSIGPLSICSTNTPSNSPTIPPSNAPTIPPTYTPSISPTITTNTPTFSPSISPTITPSNAPSIAPSKTTSLSPSNIPTNTPTYVTYAPTFMPTFSPSLSPSYPPIYVGFDTTTTTEILVTDVNTVESTNTFDKDSQSISSAFEKKWIWVVIIGIIFIVVLVFFIFICRWRSSIIKQNSIRESQRRSKETSIPRPSQTQQTNSIAYSDKIDTNLNVNNAQNIRKITDSDNDVIDTMITTGDSMYENYNDNKNNFVTPIGFSGVDSNHSNDVVNRNRNETDELFRSGSELANLAKVNAFKNGNINNLPPQPEIQEHTPRGTDTNAQTNRKQRYGKMGEKSIENPDVIAKWNSNSEHSSSDDDQDLINKKTPNATSY